MAKGKLLTLKIDENKELDFFTSTGRVYYYDRTKPKGERYNNIAKIEGYWKPKKVKR